MATNTEREIDEAARAFGRAYHAVNDLPHLAATITYPDGPVVRVPGEPFEIVTTAKTGGDILGEVQALIGRASRLLAVYQGCHDGATEYHPDFETEGWRAV